MLISASKMAAPRGQTKVLLILYDGFNTLDMNGPYDVLTKSGTSTNFSVTVASETEITRSFEGALVKVGSYPYVSRNYEVQDRIDLGSRLSCDFFFQRDRALDDAFVTQAPGMFDMLVVPGGEGERVYAQARLVDGCTMRLIQNFAGSSTPRVAGQPRVLL